MAFINTVTSVGDAALTESIITRSITELADDKITLLGRDALRGCRNLTKVDFPNLDSIGTSALQDCTKLESVILRKHLMCSLGADGLNGTPIANGTGYVYVPKTVIDVYKGSSSWSALVNQIRAYEDYAYLFSNLGKAWTAGTGDATEGAQRIAYGDGMWVATDNKICYSEDGKNWTNTKKTGNGAVVYANGLWVTSHGSAVLYSTDGKNWQTNSSAASLTALACVNGMWVGGSESTTKGACYSMDGINWTKLTTIPNMYDIGYANGMWVAIGGTYQVPYYSTDGINWTGSSLTRGDYNRVCYCGGLWFACGTGSSVDKTRVSTDGVNWEYCQQSPGLFYAIDVEYANGLWVATHKNGGVYYSTDGMNWTQSGTQGVSQVAYGGGMWITSGADGAFYSQDGINWTLGDSGVTANATIVYANDMWVAGSTSNIWYSTAT